MDPNCLKNVYVKLRYIPHLYPQEPADCKRVIFRKSPRISVNHALIPGNIRVKCAEPFTGGAGGVNLLLQVSTFVDFEIEFETKRGGYAYETHRVFVSLPIMFKLQGPRMALSAASTWPIKIILFAQLIIKGLAKVEEMEKLFGMILSLRKGFCPSDIRKLENELKAYEAKLNNLLRSAAGGGSGIASLMEHKAYGVGYFAGTCMA
jgi:hypothetical protein